MHQIPVLVISGVDLDSEQRQKLESFGKQMLMKGMLEEKELFESAIAHCQTKTESDNITLEKLKIFVNNIETKYHPDKAGEFARLWPELGELLWPQKQY